MKRFFIFLTALAMVMGLSIDAHALLIDNGNGTITDTFTGLMWLQDANYANTSGFDADGQMTWFQAQGFVAAMNTGTIGNFGFTDWRLPTALNQDGSGPCEGFNCTGSEMGHLYYTELTNVAFTSGCTLGVDCGLVNTGPFTNVQPTRFYWSGTDFAPAPNNAWDFVFGSGFQSPASKDLNGFAWAVRRPSDVSAVPEPSTMLLVGSGLAGFALFRKRFGRIHR